MKTADYFRHKRVTVVGLARSGIACANLLFDLGAEVSVTDYQDNDTTRQNTSRLKSGKIRVELGRHTPEFVKGRDMVIISPGVSNKDLPVVWAGESGIPVISEIEFAWILCPATVIAITGTNGKTTVTTLIGRVLQAAGKEVCICGNIGNPFSGEIEKMKAGGFVSLEVSSFQLEGIQTFKPKISVILNLSPNHLDRYNDVKEYLAAKKRIFMNQDKTDFLVLNYLDPSLKGLAEETKAKTVYFQGTDTLNPNFACVVAVSSILGIDRELTLRVLRDFKGLEHRLEYVAEISGVKFVNDSKSTTVDATLWALKNISQPILLIAGGREKGNDYSSVLEWGRQKLKGVILIGEARDRIEEAFRGSVSIDKADNLNDAVNIAFSRARSGDCILLSPMCKSFDMFANYEERGRLFKEAVHNLTCQKG